MSSSARRTDTVCRLSGLDVFATARADDLLCRWSLYVQARADIGRILKAKSVRAAGAGADEVQAVDYLEYCQGARPDLPATPLARADEVIERVRQAKRPDQPVESRPGRTAFARAASVAWPLATAVAKPTQRLHGVWD